MAGQREFVVRFAGEGGQGVVTAAEFVARAATTVGFHALTFATFPSQILGGPTWTQARVARDPVRSPGDSVDILVAFNDEAYEEHRGEVRPGGVILLDPSVTPDPTDTDTKDDPFIALACLRAACIVIGSEIRKESGNAISIKDGPSAIDLRGVTSTLTVLYQDLCKKYEIPSADYETFSDADSAISSLE